ncbi:BadF/BadG/BcrA/BcrD ATPase family protein [Paenibacillus arenilitoris]|uniref:ATPase n=1 Tax=Paenibacillus arenilitoris TaxID=2772299 RepID=A0A927H3N2_9BACL|nr:BadF/BadG/BcrA/BcrD ATPase family protein [Paenibacillus arenilitoris]MBD2867035.1 ATPase [Paenibacillus arenilitoris]
MRYVAGLDGGGTKTAGAVADERGNLIGAFTFGAINLNGRDEAGIRGSVREMMAAIGGLCGGLEHCAHICIGAAGVSNPTAGSRLTAMVREFGYAGGLTITGDHETAMYGSLEGASGILLIAGTGSICFGRNGNGAEHRTGGGGHLIDDEGSGYSIGRDLIAATLKAHDGRIANRHIAPMVFARLGVESVRELIGFVYDPRTNKKDIAALAPLLSELCALGDEEAHAIARRSAGALYELVVPVAEKLSLQDGELALTGGVLTGNADVRASLVALLGRRYPRLNCIAPRRDAAFGAVLIALEKL